MTEIGDDWWLLAELRAVHHAAKPPEPLDLEEDWDAHRPDPSWFLALYDQDRQLIPGTVIRRKTLSGVGVKFLAPDIQPEWVGFWSKAHPEVCYLKADLHEFEPRFGGYSSKQLVGTVHVWTVTTANTSNLSLNMAAKFTWVTSGPTSTSIITTGTSTSTVRYTTANP